MLKAHISHFFHRALKTFKGRAILAESKKLHSDFHT